MLEEYLISDKGKEYVTKLPYYWTTDVRGYGGTAPVNYAPCILMKAYNAFGATIYQTKAKEFEKHIEDIYAHVTLHIPKLSVKDVTVNDVEYDIARNVALRALGLAIVPEFKEQVYMIEEIRYNVWTLEKN